MNNYQLILNLPEPLITHYFDKSRETGKTPEQLALDDLIDHYYLHQYIARERERV